MITVIIVSVAILGAITGMVISQPESKLTYKQDSCIDTPLVEFAINTPRLGALV
jgi:hypothetical protein